MKKIPIFACLIILLQGCSSQFAYNNADWLSNWYIDDYLDLNTEQNRILKKELESVLVWHRTTQLPAYKTQLIALSKDLASLPIPEKTWLAHFNGVTQHWHTARNELSKRSAQLAPQLNDKQVNYLFRKLHEKNENRLDEFKALSIQEYRQERFETLEETIEDYLGSITPIQMEYAKAFTDHAIETEQEWFDSKYALQRAMKDSFKQESKALLSRDLYALMINPDQFKDQRLLNAYEHNRALLVTMLHNISGSLEPKQVTHFKEKIADWVELIESLERI